MWVQHYNGLLNEDPTTINDYDQDIEGQVTKLEQIVTKSEDPVGILSDQFTINEVANLCGHIPNHKSAGIDTITYESLKYGGHKL